MATESPLVHDGSNTTVSSTNLSGPAASNPGGTGAQVGGQNGSGQFLAVKIVGSRLVDLATTGDFIYGILQNKPAVGQAADVGIMGVTKAVAGGTIAAGDALSVNSSGQMVLASSTFARVGTALEAAVASTVFTMAIVPSELGRSA